MQTQNNRGEEVLPELEEIEVFKGLVRYERQMPVSQVSYYICGEIVEPQYYTELFHTLRTASSTDLIYLHLNSSGGDLNTGLQIINNMRASQARVVTILEGRAYSMAALIFLCGDELIVHDTCQLMFHTYSGNFAGKGNEQQAEVLAVSTWFEKIMRRLCVPFLTETEIRQILKGSDLWMDSDEIHHRLQRMQRAQSAAAKGLPKRVAKVDDAAVVKTSAGARRKKTAVPAKT